jgi:hypothetical protein
MCTNPETTWCQALAEAKLKMACTRSKPSYSGGEQDEALVNVAS